MVGFTGLTLEVFNDQYGMDTKQSEQMLAVELEHGPGGPP